MRRREPTLPELVRDTPVHPRSPVDEELVSFLKSLPPAPEEVADARQRVLDRMPRHRLESGSFDLDAIERSVRDSVARQAAEQLADANAATVRAIAERQALVRKWWWDRGGKLADAAIFLIFGGIAAFVINAIRTGAHP